MALVQLKPEIQIGERAVTTKLIKDKHGRVERGTEVIIIGIGKDGYDISDEYGTTICGCGFLSVTPIPIRY